MKKKLLPSLLLVAFSYSAVVGPSKSTIAILLDASGLCKDASAASWKNLQFEAFLKNHAFYGDSSYIYCRSYDASMSLPKFPIPFSRGKIRYSAKRSESGPKMGKF